MGINYLAIGVIILMVFLGMFMVNRLLIIWDRREVLSSVQRRAIPSAIAAYWLLVAFYGWMTVSMRYEFFVEVVLVALVVVPAAVFFGCYREVAKKYAAHYPDASAS